MTVRRVITGHDDAGKAVVVSDEAVDATDPDFAPKWTIWASEAPVVLPDDGALPALSGSPLLPPPGGCHVMVLTFPGHFNPDVMFPADDPVEAARAAREQMGQAVGILPDPNPPGAYGAIPGFTGMHATAGVDCLMQLYGETVLVLEGTEVRLAPGDWVVVNGVVHGWRNDGDDPAVLVCVTLGAEHKGIPLRTPPAAG